MIQRCELASSVEHYSLYGNTDKTIKKSTFANRSVWFEDIEYHKVYFQGRINAFSACRQCNATEKVLN